MNIKIGKSLGKKCKVDLGYDVSTSAQFGHCQPICCKEMVPDSEYSVEVDSLVRLSPMQCPTFGRIKYKTWHNFIPISDIYEPFEAMLAQQPYNHGGTSYIPESVPYVTVGQLSRAFYLLDFVVSPYYVTGSTSAISQTVSNAVSSGDGYFGSLRPCDSAITFGGYAICKEFLETNTAPWYDGLHSWGSGTNRATYDPNAHWWITFPKHATGYTFENLVVTPSSCDMTWSFYYGQVAISGASPTITGNVHTNIVLLQKLTDRQRRLRKVLLGLGYSLDVNNDTDTVSLLPLIAYYKAWFSTLYPQRVKTWSDTSAFNLIQKLTVNGYYDPSLNSTYWALFMAFLEDLCNTFYYDDADFYTCQLTGTSLNNNDFSPAIIDAVGDETNMVGVSEHTQPTLDTSDGLISDVQLRLLRILTKFVNKNTAIGGRIAEYLRAHYNADIVNNLLQNYFIGGDSVDVQIDDINSNASTSDTPLGDYAGKGLAYKDGKNFKFKANTFGYWIIFTAVIPRSKFFQGTDPNLSHIDRFSFFMPEVDALGYQVTPKSALANMEGFSDNKIKGISNSQYQLSETFGFVPRYSEYKTSCKNIVNGDISLPSTRDNLSMYTLDKVLTPFQWVTDEKDSNGIYNNANVYVYPTKGLVPDIYLREIGARSSLGNFDRIFYNSESLEREFIPHTTRSGSGYELYSWFSNVDDNFIIHHIVNIDAKLPMLPISQSFDTESESDNAIEVQKV